MVVKKRDASSFLDAELAALIQEYRTLIGWKTRANSATAVKESLSPGWILTIGMVEVDIRFQVRLLAQKRKKTHTFQECIRSTL